MINLFNLLRLFFTKYIKLNFKENSILLNFSFYILIIFLFSIALKNTNLLNNLAFNIVYLTTILTFIFSIDNIFQKDYDDGSLELFYLINYPFYLIIFFKIIIHWLSYGLPLTLLSPLIIIIFNFDQSLIWITYLIFYSTIYLSIWSIFFGSLILGLNNKSLILIITIIPIFLPIYIFSLNLIELEFIYIIFSIYFLLINIIINIFITYKVIKISFIT